MPITSSAKKALRRDRRRQATNYRLRSQVKKAVDVVRKGANDSESLSSLYRALDTAAKRRIVHPNKASRLKARLVKLVKSRKTTAKKPAASKRTTPSKKA